ncbi:tRNA (N(6)-L-threonylcarbamoyladenosine(37)-C(2))-methylthiotransferase MtaB [Thermostilla marina]
MPVLKTITLGCKVNQYETEYLREGLALLGYRTAVDGEPADLCIINTCTVTKMADADCRKLIRRMARENPGAEIVVTGCYATREPDEILAMPGVTEVIPDKRRLPEFLERRGLLHPPRGVSGFEKRHRAYVKIQDGCIMPCTYCIIPQVRPNLESRPLEDIAAEIRRLAEAGYREVVVTGVHLGLYGKEPGPAKGKNLCDVLSTILEASDRVRVRFSSLQVEQVEEPLLRLMAGARRRVCPHLHIPLQSGSTAVLDRMKRHYDRETFLERCRMAMDILDRPAITTDIIVGFPGETEEDFRQTCEVVSEVGFAKCHIFRFSAREGTPAAEMTDTVPGDVQRRRSAELHELAAECRRRFLESQIGRTTQVLLEDEKIGPPRTLLGMADRYVPVAIEDPTAQPGALVEVSVTGVRDDGLVGTLAAEPPLQEGSSETVAARNV